MEVDSTTKLGPVDVLNILGAISRHKDIVDVVIGILLEYMTKFSKGKTDGISCIILGI